jgi:putative colanic acid biosynthesis glycosyltransferase
MITSHQAMFYRREVIGALRYDESYNIAADYKFTLQFLHKAKKTQCVDKPVCVFAEGGVSQKNAILGRQEEQAIRKEVGIVAPFTPLRQMVAHAIKRISHQLYLKIRMITQ